jgi:hypothetical protein
VLSTHPPSSAESEGRVELYFYSTSGYSWFFLGWTLYLFHRIRSRQQPGAAISVPFTYLLSLQSAHSLVIVFKENLYAFSYILRLPQTFRLLTNINVNYYISLVYGYCTCTSAVVWLEALDNEVHLWNMSDVMNSKIKEDCVLTDGMLYLCNKRKTGFWRFKFHCRLFHPVDSTSVTPKQVIRHVSQLHRNPTLAVHHITSIPFSLFQAGSQHETKMHIPCLEFWGPHLLTTHKALCIFSHHTSHNPNTRSPL